MSKFGNGSEAWQPQKNRKSKEDYRIQADPHGVHTGCWHCIVLYSVVLYCIVWVGSDRIWISRWREQRVAVGYERQSRGIGRGGVVVVQYFCSVRRSALLCITIHISIHEACTDFKCHVDCWKSCLSIGLLSVPVPLSVHTVGLPKTWVASAGRELRIHSFLHTYYTYKPIL